MTPACRESSTSYQAADAGTLPLLVFEPGEGEQPLAGVVLFHGGGLHEGSADWLAPHCRELASRGILAVSAGYRVLGRGAAGIDDCIADVRRAVGHFRELAAVRGLDASRLASGGSSAGANLALFAALTAADTSASGPRTGSGEAVVAFNPVGLDLLSLEPKAQRRLERGVGIAAGKLGEYSLIEYVRPGNPPVLIHHGTDDEMEPIDYVRRFQNAMVRSGNECTLLEYEHAKHGFHYPGDGGGGRFEDVIDATARFLLDRSVTV